jgi:hypothetical protein
VIKSSAPRADARQLATIVAAIGIFSLLLIVARPARAEDDGSEILDPSADVGLPPVSTMELTCRACPDARVEFRELEAARPIGWKLALAAAMRAASATRHTEKGQRFGKPGPDGSYVFANSPKEVAQVVRYGLGGSSLVTQGVDALATVADFAERTTQVPLDGINYVSDAVVAGGRRLGLKRLPEFHLRSKIENDRAGVLLSARW